ncbi:MAG: PBP1A family penicillin-binding protein [Vicinamibacterales bacterium]
MPTRPQPPRRRPATPRTGRLARLLDWLRARPAVVAALVIPMVLGFLFLGYLWSTYAAQIDARLNGEQRFIPRIFGRPFVLRPGQALSPAQLEERLNDVGYARREVIEGPGEFAVADLEMRLFPRAEDAQILRVEFGKGAQPTVARIVRDADNRPVPELTLEAPMLTAFATGEKRRFTPLASIPERMRHAVLAIEDRRFYDHPGVDVFRSAAAIFTNLFGDRAYLVGGSTLTQQIVKNTFLTREQTMRRKVQEQFMALVLESRLSKDQIFELYLNEMVLGQRGPFAIHGVAEAARIFFGKDVRNVSLAEAATIAGLLQSPSRLSPFRNPERAIERRNVVLSAMVETGAITEDEADAARKAPLGLAARALENEAPYFVDYVTRQVEERYAGLFETNAQVDVYTTIDLQFQRIAQEAVAEGVVALDKQMAARKKKGQVQVALVAVDPRTGDIVAMVGGRSYSQSQYNRAVTTQRQPGSIFKPFVYLAAFEHMVAEGAAAPTPASIVLDEPTIFMDGEKPYEPGNYADEYDGPVSLRRALAMSRNIAAIKVAEATGYDRVAALWQKVGVGTPARPYPSIALGVFEASPLDIATSYTIFANGGRLRPLRALTRIVEDGKARLVSPGNAKEIARPDTTYLVTNMMRAVMNEGTGAGARSQGFRLDAAGKSGTTNELRDAWFAGLTPELLTVVWVGFDDNQPVGLGGAQAALPIWTSFMRRALAGRPDQSFAVPDGIAMIDIDPETGHLAGPFCPRTIREAFLVGTEPWQYCDLHRD